MPDLTRRRTATPIPPAAAHGFVLSAPADLADSFTIEVPSFSDQHLWEVTRWMPRGDLLPSVGDEVLAIEDDRGEVWVVAWQPS